MTDVIGDTAYPFKWMFGYTTGFIFLLGLIIYLYMILSDYLENNPSQHSTEETVWIYIFLVILIIGLLVSYYTINTNIISEKASGRNNFGFEGIRKIPVKPNGQKSIRSSKFTI